LGFFSGAALVLGAAIGYFIRVPGNVVAGVMAFGSGVLISALSFELMEEAFKVAGLTAAVSGFVLGGMIYGVANHLLAIWGARHRKRSGSQQPGEEDQAGSGIRNVENS
jgi:ZIP family zinc transporter